MLKFWGPFRWKGHLESKATKKNHPKCQLQHTYTDFTLCVYTPEKPKMEPESDGLLSALRLLKGVHWSLQLRMEILCKKQLQAALVLLIHNAFHLLVGLYRASHSGPCHDPYKSIKESSRIGYNPWLWTKTTCFTTGFLVRVWPTWFCWSLFCHLGKFSWCSFKNPPYVFDGHQIRPSLGIPKTHQKSRDVIDHIKWWRILFTVLLLQQVVSEVEIGCCSSKLGCVRRILCLKNTYLFI